MTPVPCNFFSVANSDYRVGVKLQAKHHLFQLLFCVCSVFNTGPAAVCLNSRVDEAVFNTKSDLVQQFAAAQPMATDFQCTICSGTPAN